MCELLQLPASLHDAARAAAACFPLLVPLEYLRRIPVGDPHDPLLRQVLPLAAELEPAEGYERDPVGDQAATREAGLLQKYAHRALMVTTPTCAVHCRYCFRRHFDHLTTPRTLAAWQPALDQLAADHSIEEVILSGGDPLMLTDSRLGQLLERLAGIEHIRRLRFHTRLPVMIPQRVTPALVSMLRPGRFITVVVIHANHPGELDGPVASAAAILGQAGILLLNQTVLLRGVNDSTDTLAALSRRLLELGVLPYYLHQLDRVAGAAHFHVPKESGRQIVAELRARLPGYAVPRYVQEQAGQPHKTPLT